MGDIKGTSTEGMLEEEADGVGMSGSAAVLSKVTTKLIVFFYNRSVIVSIRQKENTQPVCTLRLEDQATLMDWSSKQTGANAHTNC